MGARSELGASTCERRYSSGRLEAELPLDEGRGIAKTAPVPDGKDAILIVIHYLTAGENSR
jgi:hypothetical protein